MVTIRLARGGMKKKPFYHVVATDSRNSRDGKFLERLGFYNPHASGQAQSLELNLERIEYWTSVGAQKSERVAKLIKDYQREVANPGYLEGKKDKKLEAKREREAAAEAAAAAEREAAAAAEAAEKAKAEAAAAAEEAEAPAEEEKAE
jgi:small subunit ribosomal protein S16